MNMVWKVLQVLVVIAIAGMSWLEYEHGDALARWIRFGSSLKPEVAAAIAQADAGAKEAQVHAGAARKNLALARDAQVKAEDAMAKARAGLHGYSRQSPRKEFGATVYGYEGQVDADGEPSGYEVVNMSEGARYEGGWKAGEEGYGVETLSGGRVHAGQWEKGVNVGDGITVINGVTWQGELIGAGPAKAHYWGVLLCAADDTCLTRAGSFTLAGGAIQLDGPGVVTMRDGSLLKGNWTRDVRQGLGADLDSHGGMLAQGNYHDGQP
jgi:hypothetical protein